MEDRIICGDALTELKKLPVRDWHGRFVKGTHWRIKKPFWERTWLEKEYVNMGRSSSDIAKEFGLHDTAILYWLKKHNIKTRSISEARKLKYWGLSGSKNGMYGRIGRANPRWNGGHSPERQSQITLFIL